MRLLFIGLIVFCNLSSCQTLSEIFGGGKKEYNQANSIPKRGSDFVTGRSFANRVRGFDLEHREEAVLGELLKGNIPEFLRTFQPIQVELTHAGATIKATYWVAPDYLSIGSNEDFLRMPMTPMTAQKVCDKFGFNMPTRKMVNDIYRQAKVKLSPSPMPASSQMVSIDYYTRHQSTVQAQLGGQHRGELIAGHKKDIVNTPQLLARPYQVAIYGWHRSESSPIQPLSLVHINTYADYSHGVRLVQGTMLVDGKPMAVKDVLRDPVLSALLSDEGALTKDKLPTTVHPRSFPHVSH